MRICEGIKVVQFEVWDTRVPAVAVLVVEGDDCEKELGYKVRPGMLIGPYAVIDNVRYGP